MTYAFHSPFDSQGSVVCNQWSFLANILLTNELHTFMDRVCYLIATQRALYDVVRISDRFLDGTRAVQDCDRLNLAWRSRRIVQRTILRLQQLAAEFYALLQRWCVVGEYREVTGQHFTPIQPDTAATKRQAVLARVAADTGHICHADM